MKSRSLIRSTTVLGVVVLLLLALSACGESGAGDEVSDAEAAEAFGLAFGAYGGALPTMIAGSATGEDSGGYCTFSWSYEETAGEYSFSLNISCSDPESGVTIVGTISGTFQDYGGGYGRSEVSGDFALSGAYTASMSFSFLSESTADSNTLVGTVTINGTTYSIEELFAGG